MCNIDLFSFYCIFKLISCFIYNYKLTSFFYIHICIIVKTCRDRWWFLGKETKSLEGENTVPRRCKNRLFGVQAIYISRNNKKANFIWPKKNTIECLIRQIISLKNDFGKCWANHFHFLSCCFGPLSATNLTEPGKDDCESVET